MNRFVAGVVIGFLASWTFAIAAPSIAHNGAFWNKLTSSAKDGYVNGYSDAMKLSVAQINNLNSAADVFHWKGAHKIIQTLTTQLAMSDSPEQAVKHLDQLYSNSHYSDLDVDEALQMITIRSNKTAVPTTEDRSHAQAH